MLDFILNYFRSADGIHLLFAFAITVSLFLVRELFRRIERIKYKDYLVGKWGTPDYKPIMEFFPDGSYVSYATDYKGQYSLNSNKLKIVATFPHHAQQECVIRILQTNKLYMKHPGAMFFSTGYHVKFQ